MLCYMETSPKSTRPGTRVVVYFGKRDAYLLTWARRESKARRMALSQFIIGALEAKRDREVNGHEQNEV